MKRKLFALLLALASLLTLAACGKKKQEETPMSNEFQLSAPREGDPIAVFETDHGTFKAVLFPEDAPKAVENFITHANEKYYDGCIFHRVVKDFVAQTGDPTGTGTGGDSIWQLPFENEYTPRMHHFYGALGMANAATDKNKSQFYIVSGTTVSDDFISQMRDLGEDYGFSDGVVDAYAEIGGQPALDYRYTVFGQVIEGMDVIDSICAEKVDETSCPLDDIVLKSVTIEYYSAK